MRKKTDSLLGFARRAGALVTGAGTCEVMAAKGRLRILIVTEDTAEGSIEKMEKLAVKAGIPCKIYGLSDHLSEVTGTAGRNIFGVTDKQFAEAIEKEIDSEKSTEKEVF